MNHQWCSSGQSSSKMPPINPDSLMFISVASKTLLKTLRTVIFNYKTVFCHGCTFLAPVDILLRWRWSLILFENIWNAKLLVVKWLKWKLARPFRTFFPQLHLTTFQCWLGPGPKRTYTVHVSFQMTAVCRTPFLLPFTLSHPHQRVSRFQELSFF